VRRQLLLALAVPLLAGAVVAVPAGLLWGPAQWGLAAVAFGLCVPPGLAVLVLNDYLIRTSPFGRLAALAIGTFIRLAVGFGGGVLVLLLGGVEGRADKLAFVLWLLFAYLTTLAVETVVLARDKSKPRDRGPGA
jgi:hypothetical protein